MAGGRGSNGLAYWSGSCEAGWELFGCAANAGDAACSGAEDGDALGRIGDDEEGGVGLELCPGHGGGMLSSPRIEDGEFVSGSVVAGDGIGMRRNHQRAVAGPVPMVTARPAPSALTSAVLLAALETA